MRPFVRHQDRPTGLQRLEHHAARHVVAAIRQDGTGRRTHELASDTEARQIRVSLEQRPPLSQSLPKPRHVASASPRGGRSAAVHESSLEVEGEPHELRVAPPRLCGRHSTRGPWTQAGGGRRTPRGARATPAPVSLSVQSSSSKLEKMSGSHSCGRPCVPHEHLVEAKCSVEQTEARQEKCVEDVGSLESQATQPATPAPEASSPWVRDPVPRARSGCRAGRCPRAGPGCSQSRHLCFVRSAR